MDELKPHANLYNYRCTLLRVVDGDTVDLDVDLGLETSRKIKVRLYGVNAPEKNTPEGKAAHAWLAERLDRVKALYVQTLKDRTEKYGRYLAVLYDQDYTPINSELLAAGHAVEYYGGKR